MKGQLVFMNSNSKHIIAMLLLLGLASCQTDQNRQTQSTADMAAVLQQIADSGRQSGVFPYFTAHSVAQLEAAMADMPYTIKQGSWLDYVLVLMLKGDNDKCIAVIKAFLAANQFTAVQSQNVDFYKVMALANLRKGEIENCINNHSGQSCIMPIQGSGVHSISEPVEQAIQVYEQLLAYDPADGQSRWFLNLCYQALGQYPEGVPEQLLIPPSVFESDVEFPIFPNVSMEAGVATRNHAGGASLEDFNNDGWLDIFTTSYSLGEPCKLYINNGQGEFSDQTDPYGLAGIVGGLNNIHADFNNDGLVDIYIMRGAWLSRNGQIPNSLLINKGGYFSDETVAAGLYQRQPTGTVATADFNLDGHLDLFVGNESFGRGAQYASQLYMNRGDGTFQDVAPALGLEINQFVKGAAWSDINNDGWPDLYLSIYGQPNRLYINRGGNNIENWVFEEAAKAAHVSQPVMSFSTWFWDYDQDGYQDLMVIGYDNRASYAIASEVAKDYMGLPFQGETPRLYRNNGDETFTDVTEAVGLNKLLLAMGGNFGDLNNDGYPDCYLGTGEFNIWASIPNRAFVNSGGETFADVTSAGAFGQIQKGHGVAFGDLDRDGDQDIYHQVGGAAESDVFQNMLFLNPGFKNHWLTLKLEGTTANRSAIGARIEVQVTLPSGQKRSIYQEVGTGGSFGANSLQAEIGLGAAKVIDQVIVTWSDREHTVQQLRDISPDQSYLVAQGKEPTLQAIKNPAPKLDSNHTDCH